MIPFANSAFLMLAVSMNGLHRVLYSLRLFVSNIFVSKHHLLKKEAWIKQAIQYLFEPLTKDGNFVTSKVVTWIMQRLR